MYYILYNRSFDDAKIVGLAKKLYKKMLKSEECYLLNVCDIAGKENVFIEARNEEDTVVISGSDGTINEFVNSIDGVTAKCKMYFYSKKKYSDIKKMYKNSELIDVSVLREGIPSVTINGKEKHLFLNGIGVGIDSIVCRGMRQHNVSGVKRTYFGICKEAIKTFRPYTLDIEIDGLKHHYENVWTFMCNKGKYIGGGLKITPNAKYDSDYFQAIVIHDVSLAYVLLGFYRAYTGRHIKMKNVEVFKCRHLKAKNDGCTTIQMDGITLDYALNIEVE